MSKEEEIAMIIKMLDDASLEQVELVYVFLLHLL